MLSKKFDFFVLREYNLKKDGTRNLSKHSISNNFLTKFRLFISRKYNLKRNDIRNFLDIFMNKNLY